MTTPTDLAVEDRAYYLAFASAARSGMIHAHACAHCLAEQIEPLQHATNLPEKLRDAYVEMHRRLTEVAALAEETSKCYRYAMLDLPAPMPEASEERVKTVIASIRRFDEVERQMRRTMDELHDRLKEANRSTSGWEGVSIEAVVTLYLEPSAERRIYSELLEPVYFRPSTGSFEEFPDHGKSGTSLLGDGENWNLLYRSGHPLSGVHYGYLVHAFIEDSHLPWFLLPHVRDIEVEWRVRGERIYRAGT